MKTFVLLVLSLMAGCEVSCEHSEVKACEGGWVEFTCKYPEREETYRSVDLVFPNQTIVQSTQTNVWQHKTTVHLYHDTKMKTLRVIFTQLQKNNFGTYKCKFYEEPNSSDEDDGQEVKLQLEDGCQTQFTQTAYRQTQTTITCGDSGNKRSSVQFFCRDDGFTCEDILSTDSPLKSNGTFSLTESSRGFSVSISNVSSHHAAVYWCGEKPGPGSYRAALRKIRLEVEDITTLRRSPAVGQTFTYWCKYTNGASVNKFICKGEDPSTCQRLRSTAHRNMTSGRFSIKDDRERRNITITVRGVRADDTGTYWCGAESSDKRRSNKFFNRLLMTVVPSTTAEADGRSWLAYRRLLAIIVAVVCVAVLVLVLVLVFIYKRFKRSEDREALEAKEERPYEEIVVLPQKPGSGTALKSVYVTADFPTNPSAKTNSNVVGGQTGLPGDPFYSTVCSPQQL